MILSESVVEECHYCKEGLLDFLHRGSVFALFRLLSSLEEVRLLGFIHRVFKLFDTRCVSLQELFCERKLLIDLEIETLQLIHICTLFSMGNCFEDRFEYSKITTSNIHHLLLQLSYTEWTLV